MRRTTAVAAGAAVIAAIALIAGAISPWYEVASRFEKSRLELAKAQKSFDYFQNHFENVGKNLNKAQEAFETAQRHLKTYRGRVTVLSGQEQLELDAKTTEDAPPLTDKASA